MNLGFSVPHALVYVLLVIMTVIGAWGSFFLKRASASDGIARLASDYNFYLGGFLYFLSALLNIFVLQFLPYSTVLPMTSLTYVWTMLIGTFLLGEKQSLRSVLGIILIVCGVTLMI